MKFVGLEIFLITAFGFRLPLDSISCVGEGLSCWRVEEQVAGQARWLLIFP